jgi:hypothetical protein
MYNQLHLRPEALPYSLFLFHESLDDSVPPDIWIMTRAWYGVSSTGNQAGIALERLAEESADTLPAALFPLTKGRYVDDGLSGADSIDEREEQIRQTQECLATGGFALKYVAKSGEAPPEKATADGKTVSCLGLKWAKEADTICLGLNPMCLKKKLKRLETVWKAEKKFRHLLHRKRGAAENSCAICKGTLHCDLEELVTGTVNRAASKQVKSTYWKIAHFSCQ